MSELKNDHDFFKMFHPRKELMSQDFINHSKDGRKNINKWWSLSQMAENCYIYHLLLMQINLPT